MATKRTFSCGTNAGYPEEARWAPMPARVAYQNAEDGTGGGGWVPLARFVDQKSI